jgi:hypothetical protein
LSTTLVEPVLVRVAAIFVPTLPDLPMPTMTILPRCFSAAMMFQRRSSNDLVELRAHGLERGEFDVEHFAGFGEMVHGSVHVGIRSRGF